MGDVNSTVGRLPVDFKFQLINQISRFVLYAKVSSDLTPKSLPSTQQPN